MTDAARHGATRWIVLGVIALVVLVAAGLFAFEKLRPADDPGAVAAQYWQLLADGKAQQALALTDLDSPPNGLLLTDAVYGTVDRGISEVTIVSSSQKGDTATAAVGLTLDGTATRVPVTLTKIDNGPLQPASWRITGVKLATVNVSVAGEGHAKSLSVDGAALDLPGGDGTIAIPALPGRYELALGSDSPLYSGISKTVSVGIPEKAYAVSLGLAPSAELKQQAVALATKTVNGCFAQPTLTRSCSLAQGIRNLFNLTAEETVTYHLDKVPSLQYAASGMSVTTKVSGEVTANPTDSYWGSFDNHAVFSLRFDVAITNGEVVVTPHQGGVTLVDYTD